MHMHAASSSGRGSACAAGTLPSTAAYNRMSRAPWRSFCRNSSSPAGCAGRDAGSDSSSSRSSSSSGDSSRRLLLAGGGSVLAALMALPQSAEAAVTLTLRGRSSLKPYTLKAGFTVTVPDSWALAYDRSDSAELGTQVFFGDFRTFETLSIFKLEAGSDDSESPEQLLERVIAEQRDNASTFGFTLISGPVPAPRTVADDDASSSATTTYYDSEYELAVCRGLAQEGSGGRRRCVGPRDMDLQVVSRHFVQTFARRGRYVYVARGSATSEAWSEVGPAALAAVQSFRLGSQTAAGA